MAARPKTAKLKQVKLAVGTEITVEGDRLADSQPLHNYETERVAIRVKLVPVRSNQRDRFLFIVLADSNYVVGIGLDRVQKFQCRSRPGRAR
jgi:hypothetical protein